MSFNAFAMLIFIVVPQINADGGRGANNINNEGLGNVTTTRTSTASVLLLGRPNQATVSADDANWCATNPSIRVLSDQQYAISGSLLANRAERPEWPCVFFCIAPPDSKLIVEIHFTNSSEIWPNGCSFTAWDVDDAFYATVTPVISLPGQNKPNEWSNDEAGMRIHFITKTRTLLVDVEHCAVSSPNVDLNFTITIVGVVDDGMSPAAQNRQRMASAISRHNAESWQRLWVAFVEIPLMVFGCVLYYAAIRCCYKMHMTRRMNRHAAPNLRHWHFGPCFCAHCPANSVDQQVMTATGQVVRPNCGSSNSEASSSSNNNSQTNAAQEEQPPQQPQERRPRSPSSPTVSIASCINERPPPYESVVRQQRAMSSSTAL